MRESARKVVLVHLGRWSAARQRFAGICRYARQHGWTLHLVEDIAHDISYPWKDAIDYWRPDGVIIDGDDVYVPPRMKGLAVHCDADPRKMHGPYYGVVYDSIGATEKAIGELKSLAYGHYAFAGYYVRVGWAEVRRNRFLKEFAGFRSPTFVLEDGNGQVVDHLRRMRVWLQSLPKPCGIFAANDRIGRDLANFCLQLGYAVPGDVAIVGIDNDETLCDGSEPTLTSATQNFDESGYRAAEMLDRGDSHPAPVDAPLQRGYGTAQERRRLHPPACLRGHWRAGGRPVPQLYAAQGGTRLPCVHRAFHHGGDPGCPVCACVRTSQEPGPLAREHLFGLRVSRQYGFSPLLLLAHRASAGRMAQAPYVSADAPVSRGGRCRKARNMSQSA